MWKGKNKAVTFSFDDGVLQDKKLVSLLDRYGIKATFNLNSAKFGFSCPYEWNGKRYERSVIDAEEVKSMYRGHEVAAHTLTHTNLTTLSKSAARWQIERDRRSLSGLVGYEVVGLAYPCGGINYDDNVRKAVEETGVKYARRIEVTHGFSFPEDLLAIKPSAYWCEQKSDVYALIDEFIALQTSKSAVLYIWGHSYELDDGRVDIVRFENALKILAARDDLFFGTNRQVFLKEDI